MLFDFLMLKVFPTLPGTIGSQEKDQELGKIEKAAGTWHIMAPFFQFSGLFQ